MGRVQVNLCNNNLGEPGWCAIFDALRDNPQNKITKWKLSFEGINPTIAKSLAAYAAVSASLTDLNLYGNGFGDEGVATICNAVKKNKETKLATLNIGNSRVTAAGAKPVAAMLAVTSSLTKLDVRHNYMGAKGEAAIKEAVRGKAGFKLEI